MIATTARFAGLVSAASLLVAPAAFSAAPAPAHPVKAGKTVAWSFPSCTVVKAPDYDYIYSGDPCVTSPAVPAPGAAPASVAVAGVSLPIRRGSRFPGCADTVDYEYIFSGC